jgi:hypothetical protein
VSSSNTMRCVLTVIMLLLLTAMQSAAALPQTGMGILPRSLLPRPPTHSP